MGILSRNDAGMKSNKFDLKFNNIVYMYKQKYKINT